MAHAAAGTRPQDLFPVETDSPEATRALGRSLGTLLPMPWVIALYGEMGVGKTHFVKGLADALGFDGDDVSSPTFTIVHEMRRGTILLRHIDAYRIERARDLDGFDLDDLFYGDDPCVVEWPERLGFVLPPDTVRLRLEHVGPSRRRVSWMEGSP